MRYFFWIVFMLPAFFGHAQQNIVIRIKQLPSYHLPSEDLYLAGSFNGWNPGDPRFRLLKDSMGYSLSLTLSPGRHEYKITRGTWEKVETSVDGAAIGNRSLIVASDTSIRLSIAGWADHFPRKPLVSTAGKNVAIIDTAFRIPQLGRSRRVWIYLPEGYHTSKARYPVLYMHDGQNVFDQLTSYSGEWGVDECIDSMKKKYIVVAVDHGNSKRINEYCPYDMEKFGKGEGDQYVDFLVRDLKPHIDRNYRTKKGKSSTFIAGSSMGGLISMYALLKYPGVFGGAGVFSPAFWVGPAIFDEIKKKGRTVRSRIYFYAGKKEGAAMVPDMLKAFNLLSKTSKSKIIAVIRDEGEHNEARWRLEFPSFYKWLSEIENKE